MTRKLLWILVAALTLPILVRFLWYSPGFRLPHSVATPDYSSFKLPEAPISTPQVAPVKQEHGTVLFDNAHSNEYQLSEIRSLTDALTQRGGTFVLNSKTLSLEDQLKSADAYVVISPADPLTPDEVALVRAFVSRGGRLAVFTDATRGVTAYDYYGNPVGSVPDVNAVNPLLAPFNITANPDYLYDLTNNEGNFRNVFLDSSAQSSLTAGVKQVTFYGAHSLSTDSGAALLVGGAKTLSSSTDALPEGQSQKGWAAAIQDQDGNVLAFGDFSFLASPYDEVADNRVLIGNIAGFLLASPRQPTLADYPFLFQGNTVNLLTTSDLQMTAAMTGKLSKLQAALAGIGMQLKVAQQAPSQGDLIVLGSYSPSDDLSRFTKPFGLTLDSYGEYVKLAPFGKIGQSGNGLLLFRTGTSGNTLVVLASDLDDMTGMLDTLSGGDLSDCILQGDLAACSVGIGGTFLETTPTPETTPTGGAG